MVFIYRETYLQTLISTLDRITKLNTTDEEGTFSVKQIQSMKTAIEQIVSIGIIPCLEKSVGTDIAKLCSTATKIPQENLNCEQVRFFSNI